ncbi:MAG: DUF6241 domain-containing protein [Clostridium sp.]
MDEEEIVIDLTEKRSKVMKLIIILLITAVVVGIGFFAYRFVNRNFGPVNEAAKETLNEIKVTNTKSEQEKIVKDYDFVHQMSNNLIVASDGMIWGNQDVTLENIDLGIEMLKNDDYIVTELNKWKEGDFKNATDVHNYCWRILEGSIGKAKGNSKEGIDKALKAIGKE